MKDAIAVYYGYTNNVGLVTLILFDYTYASDYPCDRRR